MKILHVIFDWSGTLCDDHAASFLATRKTIRYFSGQTITHDEYREFFTIPVEPFYRRYDRKTPFQEIDRHYFITFEKYLKQSRLFPGARETLKLLKRLGITTSIVSTVRQDLLESLCDRHGIRRYFSSIQGSAHDKRTVLASHLKKVRAKRVHTLFIGDMAHDIEAAHSCDLMSGCVLSGYQNAEQLLPHRPRLIWNAPCEWPLFFKALTAAPAPKAARPYPVVTVSALILNRHGDAFFTLTHKWGFQYGIPGGKVHKGETLNQALVREIFEETGLRIQVKQLLLAMEDLAPDGFYLKNCHFIYFNYLATTRTSKIALNPEAQTGLWLPPQLARHLPLNAPTRRLLETYLANSHSS